MSHVTPWMVGQCSPVHLTPEQLAEFAAGLNAYLAAGPAGLDELRALSDAATPGPWRVEAGPNDEPEWPDVEIVAPSMTPGSDGEALLTGQISERADAAFLVAAVNYVRDCLAERGAGE